MLWKRRAGLSFGTLVGAALVALVADDANISSDDHMTGIIVAFLFGSYPQHPPCSVTASACWYGSAVGARTAAGILVLGFAAIVNVSNSLDAVIGRNAKTYSEAGCRQADARQSGSREDPA